jgi:methylated-DNA-[protein]-cysteine S-methyltransferase
MNSPFVPAPAPRSSDAPWLFDTVDSPVGTLLLIGDEDVLTSLYMLDADEPPPPAQSRASFAPDAFAAVKEQLAAYFAGTLTEFTVPLAPRGSAFQLAVWAELTRIPYGFTTSYGAIARALGKSPVASRAVGSANGANPIPIIVPCHRVIGADGGLTGYGGGLPRKLTLLQLEGSAGLW